MNKSLSFLTFLGLFLAISSCSDGISISYDYDKEVDFLEYKSFGFLPWPEENDALVNEFDKKRILSATRNEFEARGMKYVEGTTGDVAVNVFITAERMTELQSYTNYYNSGYGYYYSPYMMGGGASTTTTQEVDYILGTVLVDVFDVSEKKLVWQGVGQGVVDDKPKDRDENVEYAMGKILSQYPVQKTK